MSALSEPLLPPVTEPLAVARANARDVEADYLRDGWLRADLVWIELAAAGVPLEGARAGVDVHGRAPQRVEVPFGPAWAVTAARVLLPRHPADVVEDFLRGCVETPALREAATVACNAANPTQAIERLFAVVM